MTTTNKERNREQYNAYKGRLCWMCKKVPVTDGHAYCIYCREFMKEKYKARKGSSICARCGNPALEGETRCQRCKDMVNSKRNLRRAIRRSNGLKADN